MYECTICGQTKATIGKNPEYDFRRPRTRPEERTIVGSSDYCSRCHELSFFVHLEDSEEEDSDGKTRHNAPGCVFQHFGQTVGSTSASDLQDDCPHRPPKVPHLQKRHYLRKKKPPLTPPTWSEKQQQQPPLTPRCTNLQLRQDSSPRSSGERPKLPAKSCCRSKDLRNRRSSKTSHTQQPQPQQPNLKMNPIYPVEDMHMQQIARYSRHCPKAPSKWLNEEQPEPKTLSTRRSRYKSLSSSHSSLNLQHKIKENRKLVRNLTRIQSRTGNMGGQSQSGCSPDAPRSKAALGERLMDVLKEKSGGHSIEANVQQQQQQQQQMPVSLVQRCNYELIIPNPCLATGKPAWPAESQFSTALHGVDVLQSPDEPKTAFRKLKVRRNPIQCPDADCQGTCFVSDILSHIISNHSTVTIDRMGLRQTRTCFLDANETRLNKAKCHQIFVVQGMIISAEGDALQHQLPVLLMSARIRHRDVIGHCRSGSSVPECEQLNDDSQEMLLLWLTSLKPTNQRVLGTLAVRAPDRPDTMMVTTARTYDIRDSHELGALLASPSIMIIPHTVLQRLSRKRKQLIVIQAQIH